MPKSESIPIPATVLERPVQSPGSAAVFSILLAVSLGHFLNDTIQALIPAIYPLLKETFHLSFAQIGIITFCFQMVSSVIQPLVGFFTDRYPQPRSLVWGMGVTLVGLLVLAWAPSYEAVLIAAALVGVGSAVFHPEASRMARLASGGRQGFAQSFFQVGGNAGTALGPVLAAWIVVPHGQKSIVCFSVFAVAGMVVLGRVGNWYRKQLHAAVPGRSHAGHRVTTQRSRSQVLAALSILVVLMFSKFIYLAAMTNYFTFYLMHRFGVSVASAQFHLFIFLVAGVVGTLVGGPLGDRIGRKQIIWISILGIAPFAMALPYANLMWTTLLTVAISMIMASAFPAILVYATELVPDKVGLIAGLFFGLAFGLAGIGSAALGKLADLRGIEFVMSACSFLPWIGLATYFLPDLRSRR